MKKKVLSSIFMLLALSMTLSNVKGQEDSTDFEMKDFGLGLHVQQFKISEIDEILMPANRVLFTFNNSDKTRRIEPEFGFFYSKDTDFDWSVRGIQIGFGVFRMQQVEKTNIYYGGRFSFANIKESNHSDYSTSILGFGPGLGAEYFFSRNFSIGGEISLRFMTISEDDYTDFFDEYVINTSTGLILRLYM